MMYMKAHGNAAGPSHRPYLAASISAIVAGGITTGLMVPVGVLRALKDNFGLDPRISWLAPMLVFFVAGLAYAKVFNRAANDFRGGWLFGLSFGFITWMLGPATTLDWILARPFVVGETASGLFGLHLLFGLLLGLLYPVVHGLVQDHNDPLGERSESKTSAAQESKPGGPTLEPPAL